MSGRRVKAETVAQYITRIEFYTKRFDPTYKPVVPPLAKRLTRLRAW